MDGRGNERRTIRVEIVLVTCRAHKFVMADQLVLLDVGTGEASDRRARSACGAHLFVRASKPEHEFRSRLLSRFRSRFGGG